MEKDDDVIIENTDDAQQASIAGHDPVEGTPFYQRMRVFGTNLLPEKNQKFIFELMWMAMQETGLSLLTIAALISLALDIYKDSDVKEEVNQPKIRWIGSIAIIIAILIVIF